MAWTANLNPLPVLGPFVIRLWQERCSGQWALMLAINAGGLLLALRWLNRERPNIPLPI